MSLLQSLLGGNQAQMPGAMSQPSGLSRLLQPEVALPMAAALLGNQGNMANLGNAFGAAAPALQQQKLTAQKNKTGEWLRTQDPRYGQMLDSGFEPADVYSLYLNERKVQDPTSLQQEYNAAVEQGYTGNIMDYQIDLKKAGASSTNVTVGNGKYGTIPQGYMLNESPEGVSMAPIPGGPEDTSKKDALAAGQADIATRVVTSAASRAREAARNRQMGGFGQGVVSNLPWTDSAEVARQVDVLKSTAKVENLTAMRAASPTGGALGSVTKEETDMLAAKSGALDPSSPTFERDLDDYELTLLQVVHGPQEGSRIWQKTRSGGGSPAMPAQQPQGGGNTTRTGVQWSVGP